MDGPEPDDDGGRRRTVAVLILVVVLVAGGVWLAQHLREANRVQDCVMAGRNNCAAGP